MESRQSEFCMSRMTTVPRRKGVQHVVPQVAKTVERIDPNEDFSDVNGSDASQFKLENERSDRKYCWPTDTAEDRQKYQGSQLRWIPEVYEGDDVPGALRPVGSYGLLKKGDLIRVGVHIVLSCDRAKWEKQRRWEASQTLEGRKLARRHERAENVIAGQHSGGWQGLDGVNSQMEAQE